MINQNKHILFITYLYYDNALLATEERLKRLKRLNTGTFQGHVLPWKEHQSQTEANFRQELKPPLSITAKIQGFH